MDTRTCLHTEHERLAAVPERLVEHVWLAFSTWNGDQLAAVCSSCLPDLLDDLADSRNGAAPVAQAHRNRPGCPCGPEHEPYHLDPATGLVERCYCGCHNDNASPAYRLVRI